ncbi:MAG: Crp/Fnr family transcriptional regulator [Dysgonamonadaceae bacterium]
MVKNKSKDFNFAESIPELWEIFDEKDRQLISSNLRIMEFRKNEVVYYEDEEPRDFMCLLKGKVKIYKSGVGGRSQIIRMAKPVEYFGYRAYFAGEKYVTAASAFEPSIICMIPMELIKNITERNTRLAMFFIKLLSVDLGISDARVVNLTQKHIRGRLAESLIFLMENYGLEEDGATISIYLSREDIANLSNMTTSNAIRTLSTFVNEHIITMDGRKIKIIDEERLRKISRIG